jgi:hypothetical protein
MEALEADRREYQQWWVMHEIGDVIPLPYPEEQQPYRGMLYMRREDRLHHDWTPDLHDASAVGDVR